MTQTPGQDAHDGPDDQHDGPTGPAGPAGPGGGAPGHDDALADRLARIEALLTAHHAATRTAAPAAPHSGGGLAEAERLLTPAWRRVTRGEPRWASAAAVLAVVAIQFTLPQRLAVHPRWLMPVVELALLVALAISDPVRIESRSRGYRALGFALMAAIGSANVYAMLRLLRGLIRGTEGASAGTLLLTGGAIWLTNVIVFGLLYWELDRGGPGTRAQGVRQVPDFLFVQMQSPDLAPPHWEPAFLDYFYLSFTNSTAFSPTDVMPVTRWAKMLMLAQSVVSLLTVVLVVARAVNIL
ncbi:hypothetical protein ABZ901_11455 [Actinacidiphila alni]|uniref:hypothetical protein n=1 Tax=Actinacidiphila alni TaxID=380248 RepID=UPI00340DE370